MRWRDLSNAPAAGALINSPYDQQALFAQKRETFWTGYKVHLTETCDEDSPHLITHVETTLAPQADDDALPYIHQALAAHDLLPEQHIVDTGYVDAQELVNSRQDYDVDLFGPTRLDYHWQARENSGFAASQFGIDWQEKCATCPQARPVRVGHQPKIDEAIPLSKSNLPSRIVVLARVVPNALKASRTPLVEPSRYAPSLNIKRCKPHESVRPLKPSKLPMTNAPELRERSPKVFVPLDYAKHATKASPKSICSTFSLRLLSILLGFSLGAPKFLEHKHDKLPLCDLSKKEPKEMRF